jgi:hypothetical protein
LKGPIDALQNAASYNYYANSTFTKEGRYYLPSAMADMQHSSGDDLTSVRNRFTDRKNENKISIDKIKAAQVNASTDGDKGK